MRISAKSYFKPTPKKFRILGDTLAGGILSGSMTITTMDLTKNQIAVGVISLTLLAMVIKALTNFFTDDVIDPNKS